MQVKGGLMGFRWRVMIHFDALVVRVCLYWMLFFITILPRFINDTCKDKNFVNFNWLEQLIKSDDFKPFGESFLKGKKSPVELVWSKEFAELIKSHEYERAYMSQEFRKITFFSRELDYGIFIRQLGGFGDFMDYIVLDWRKEMNNYLLPKNFMLSSTLHELDTNAKWTPHTTVGDIVFTNEFFEFIHALRWCEIVFGKPLTETEEYKSFKRLHTREPLRTFIRGVDKSPQIYLWWVENEIVKITIGRLKERGFWSLDWNFEIPWVRAGCHALLGVVLFMFLKNEAAVREGFSNDSGMSLSKFSELATKRD